MLDNDKHFGNAFAKIAGQFFFIVHYLAWGAKHLTHIGTVSPLSHFGLRYG